MQVYLYIEERQDKHYNWNRYLKVFIELYLKYPEEQHGLSDVELLIYMQLPRDCLECQT